MRTADFKGGRGGDVSIGAPRKITIRHYYQLKSFNIDVRVKHYSNQIIIENFRLPRRLAGVKGGGGWGWVGGGERGID